MSSHSLSLLSSPEEMVKLLSHPRFQKVNFALVKHHVPYLAGQSYISVRRLCLALRVPFAVSSSPSLLSSYLSLRRAFSSLFRFLFR